MNSLIDKLDKVKVEPLMFDGLNTNETENTPDRKREGSAKTIVS